VHSQVDNDVSQATAASLATFFKQIGLADANGMLDRSISFITRDKRASWLKSSKKVCKSVTVCCIVTLIVTLIQYVSKSPILIF